MAAVLEVVLQGKDQLSGTVAKANVGLGSLVKTGAAMAVGFAGVQGAMYGVKNALSSAIGDAMAFEHQMAQIRGLTGATKEDTNLLEGAIKDMAHTMPKSPAELGAGAYFVISAGITDAAEAADVLEISAKASAAGLGETQVVADAVTSALNAYKLEASDAEHVTDILTTTVRLGKTQADALAGSIGRILPVASAMGVSFEEVGANLAVMTKVGLSADEAATSLRAAMTSLLKPTSEAEEALAAMGTSSDELRQQIREEGLLATLQNLMDLTGGNTAEITKIIPNVRALTNVLGTVGSQGETYVDTLNQMNNASGATEKAFGEVADTTQFKLQLAMNELNLALEELGTEALPAVASAAAGLSTTVRILSGDMDALKGASVDVLGGLKDVVVWNLKGGVAGEAFASGIKSAGGALGIFASGGEADAALEEAQASWAALDVQLANAAQTELDVAAGAEEAAVAEEAQARSTDSLVESLKETIDASKEMVSLIDTITGQYTAEANAIDLQINALQQEQVAAQIAEQEQAALGDAVGSTTSAIDQQIGALDQQIATLENLAASKVPQSLRDEIIALDAELAQLELNKLAIEAQIMVRDRLAAQNLEEARIKNLPAMAKEKDLELERAKILDKVGGDTEKLTDKQKARIDAIDNEIRALQASMDVVNLEAEAENAAAEATDKHRQKLENQLWAIDDQITATSNLKREKELYQETLLPPELQQEIDALKNQKTVLGNVKTGMGNVKEETKKLSDTIGDQIELLQLQRTAIDLVTEGWKLEAEAMLGLPTMPGLRKQLANFFSALFGKYAGDIYPQPMQHGGYVPSGVVTPAVLHGPEWVIPEAMMGAGRAVTVNLNIASKYPPNGSQLRAEVREMLPEIRRAVNRGF